MLKNNKSNFHEGYYYQFNHYMEYSERMEILQPLVNHLKIIDSFRHELYYNSISLNKLIKYRDLLSEPVTLRSVSGNETFTLSEHTKFDRIVHSLHLWDTSLQVRRDKHSFPQYLLCETSDDFDCGYGLVMSEYYSSFDFERLDDRFVKLMHGHERYFINLEIFRQKLEAKACYSSQEIERTLMLAGKNYLQIAWHDDQIISFLIADLFKLTELKAAIEIIYLIMGSDLSSLRSNYTSEVRLFFTDFFPRSSLGLFLNKMEFMSAKDYQSLEKKSSYWYTELNQYFSALLGLKIEYKSCIMPAYKLIFANIFRLNLMSSVLLNCPGIEEAVADLKHLSESVLKDIINPEP